MRIKQATLHTTKRKPNLRSEEEETEKLTRKHERPWEAQALVLRSGPGSAQPRGLPPFRSLHPTGTRRQPSPVKSLSPSSSSPPPPLRL